MLNDDENNVICSLVSPEPDDAANNTSQTEAAPGKPVETGVEVTKDACLSKDEVACAMSITESARLVSEEEKSEIIRKPNKVEVEKGNGAKASKTSWRIMFHKKEVASISSSHLDSKHYDAANDSQSESNKVSDDASTVKLMLGSEQLKTQGSVMEDGNILKPNNPDEDRNLETNVLGKESIMEGDGQQKEEGEIEEGEKLEHDNVVEGTEPALAVEKQDRERKKVLKKTERTGMIFMCNKRTKQDCFDYKVFGLPANMRDVVRKVSKGTRLFLFDIDLRVMYGIYRAAAPGGYNIEPNAFNSAFPSQVRFTVVEDCTPLPEEKFRMAIKENYYRRNMFNCQLTSEQVKKLSKFFVDSSGVSNLTLKNYVKQENLHDEEIDEESVTVRNKEKSDIEAENEETATGEEKKNEDHLVIEDKAIELICLEGDSDDQEISCKEEEASTSDGCTGMIFLCNSNTKQDCLHYKVLGLPANMREIVQKVNKGMRLFMFDVDLRVMYGIYKAAEPGGYNIEPKAFNSAFPSQVRFTVVKDCPPIPEEGFRMAIIDNYYWKNKFNCQLTSEQVNKLSKLFVTASRGPGLSVNNDLASNFQGNAIMPGPVDMNIEGNCVEKENPIQEEAGGNFEKKITKKRKRGTEKKLVQRAGTTGMIFMCNSKTKQDCLHYKVLGLPANMKESVQKVQKGMRLFMFDVDLRVMYGIYTAAGPGGYNIEPKAFNSGFPSQVRFTVVEDCLPLGEEEFKAAIKDNYYTQWKFKAELTSEQVKNLCKLFSSAGKGRDLIRQQNLERRYHKHRINYAGDSCVQSVLVPMDQLPPLSYTAPDVSQEKVYVNRGGPLLRPHGQRRFRSRQLKNRGVTLRSRERKKMLYVKEIEMKSRYFEGECRRLEMLLQYSAAENQALRVSLQNVMAS